MLKISKPVLCKAVAEAIGTFAIVFFGCGSIAVIQNSAQYNVFIVPAVFGLTVALMIYSVGHISGAHFNPAVSLAFTLVNRFPRSQLALYWAAQLIGAITGAFLLRVLLPDAVNLGVTILNVGILHGLVWEAVLSFFLMFVIISVATDSRAVGIMAGAAIGAIVTVNALVGGPYTGASMNPARSLGPAIVAGSFADIFVYLIGPTVGALLAAKTYEFIRCEFNSEPTQQHGDKKQAKGCC